MVDADKMSGAQFFPGARLNHVENLLGKDGAGAALVFWGEDKVKRRVSWAELRVARTAEALRESGKGVGDRVGGHPATSQQRFELVDRQTRVADDLAQQAAFDVSLPA